MTRQARGSGLLIPALLVVVAVALWVGWGVFVTVHFQPSQTRSADATMAVRGQFGDMFGGINALFSALVLAGAVYAVWLR